MRAIWNEAVLAESDNTVVVENNPYFPADSVNMAYFRPYESHSNCPWEGVASYYIVEVDGKKNKDAAWYYPNPNEAALHIKGRVAFWKDVESTV